MVRYFRGCKSETSGVVMVLEPASLGWVTIDSSLVMIRINSCCQKIDCDVDQDRISHRSLIQVATCFWRM